MLITRPNHDITTNYLYFWSEILITKARKTGYPVVDLSRKRANKKELLSIIKKVNPNFIVFNGHGNDSTIFGYDNEPLIEVGINEELLNSKIVYARSCSAVKKLGKSSIKNGCSSFIGYDDEFVFIIDNDIISHPLQDTTAKLFLDPSNYIVLLLLKGHTVSEANRRSKEKYRQTILNHMISTTKQEDRDLIPFLARNYIHQVCLGNQEATI